MIGHWILAGLIAVGGVWLLTELVLAIKAALDKQ